MELTKLIEFLRNCVKDAIRDKDQELLAICSEAAKIAIQRIETKIPKGKNPELDSVLQDLREVLVTLDGTITPELHAAAEARIHKPKLH